MGKSIYKYVGYEYLDKVLKDDKSIIMKCSYPKSFNDPYELFLTVDYNQPPEVLAFYAETVGEIKQLPTTCFSKSPIVLPMWAHYAQNHQGFVVEFDEEKLAASFGESGFGDVDYLDGPPEGLTGLLGQASVTLKPRHTYMLRQGVFSAAYYTKATCWSYEQERRMVLQENEIRHNGELMLMDAPNNSVTSLIAGSRTSEETKKILRARAELIGCGYYELRTGKSSSIPYLVDIDVNTFIFIEEGIVPCINFCMSCKEPISADDENCPWCKINDAHKATAASTNPYRILNHFGMLEDYVKSMNEISQKYYRKKD